ncbi:DUF3592 domain-containing protein [Natronoglycomyces albus]|uniref:DUF3592 domain-containing protein n=1 Tax=Natronoglycomyces albus TaxID=2811108 RepID=A0A895XP62_9ACTN|nr:DUF3592 domain-containing protein [Natronoglycomyces albus]QSB04865.1 DUF3592 domain-containing protein [Natronoglycomyces albus]
MDGDELFIRGFAVALMVLPSLFAAIMWIKHRKWIRVVATVQSLRKRKNPQGSPDTVVHYKYTDLHGRNHRGSSTGFFLKPKIGAETRVMYHPEDPGVSDPASTQDRILFLGIIVAMFAAGLFFLLMPMRMV